MAVKTYAPTSPGKRFRTGHSFEEITADKPEKSLLAPKKRSGGRNSRGRTTIWHRGGGHKRKYRKIDFRREKLNVPAKVVSIEYDPNRTARIALLSYADGEKRYIIAPAGLRVGSRVVSGPEADIQVGNTLPLRKIPPGTPIHNIELKKGKGGQLVRAAGGSATILAKEGSYAQLRLPSSEVRMVLLDCTATIGQVGNLDNENISLGKAGRKRWLGRKPVNRGVTMNPIDHPHGGGEGRTSGGRHPSTPWGKPTKGYKTRSNPRTQGMIVRRRVKKGHRG